jgi:cell wall assembly regulator SMI1
MGWYVSWSTQGSIITFTETLKTKEIVATNLANLLKNLART